MNKLFTVALSTMIISSAFSSFAQVAPAPADASVAAENHMHEQKMMDHKEQPKAAPASARSSAAAENHMMEHKEQPKAALTDPQASAPAVRK